MIELRYLLGGDCWQRNQHRQESSRERDVKILLVQKQTIGRVRATTDIFYLARYLNILSYSLWEHHSRIMAMISTPSLPNEYSNLQAFGRSYLCKLFVPYFLTYYLGIRLLGVAIRKRFSQ